jgi:dihydrofolate reductase
VAKLIYSAIA